MTSSSLFFFVFLSLSHFRPNERWRIIYLVTCGGWKVSSFLSLVSSCNFISYSNHSTNKQTTKINKQNEWEEKKVKKRMKIQMTTQMIRCFIIKTTTALTHLKILIYRLGNVHFWVAIIVKWANKTVYRKERGEK